MACFTLAASSMVHSCELVSSLVVMQFDKQSDCLQRGSMSVVGLANAYRDAGGR